jgi:hypothetical protein
MNAEFKMIASCEVHSINANLKTSMLIFKCIHCIQCIQGLVHFPFLHTRSSEQSFSVEQEAPAQCPDQEHVVVGEEPVVIFVIKVVVGLPEPPDRPKFFARAAIKLSPIDRSVVKLVI